MLGVFLENCIVTVETDYLSGAGSSQASYHSVSRDLNAGAWGGHWSFISSIGLCRGEADVCMQWQESLDIGKQDKGI